MARYFQFSGGSIDFPIRADFSQRIEYFSDFVFGGTRDKTVYGKTRITPQITVAYDVNGLKFLYYVLGTISASTIAVGSTIPESFYYVTVENDNMSLHGAKVDTWELTVEEGSPVRAEFTAIGKNIGTTGASPFTPDFNNPPKMRADVTITVGGSPIEYDRLSLRISNGIEPIYKGSLNPQELRETGLEVTGRIRAPKYSQFISEGAMVITISNVGQISMPNVRLTEVPPRVSGFDLPETEISFRAYPTTTEDAIKVTLTNTLKW